MTISNCTFFVQNNMHESASEKIVTLCAPPLGLECSAGRVLVTALSVLSFAMMYFSTKTINFESKTGIVKFQNRMLFDLTFSSKYG